MPRHIPYRLQWSSETQEYSILHDGRPLTPQIELSSRSWFAWLESITSFAFQSRSGEDCTVRKERVQRGGSYWYAYRRRERRMVKRYLARTTDLTLARLEGVTAALNGDEVLYRSPLTEPASSSLLLMTKLHQPRLPMQYVSRPRLLSLLQQGIQGSLTLVSAPAGSGKTTLLTEFASVTALPMAWISLETADNDPIRFLSYFMAAVAGLDERLDAAIQAYRPHAAQDAERVLISILNDLTRLPLQDAIVILDDYHVLTTDSVHAQLRFLLDHLPANLHIVIGTRVDPPLPLAQLRARRQLCEVRMDDLRFVSDEVEALIQTMGITLSYEATGLLEQHTEGWIAGIQLLALALRGQQDATAFLRTFQGTHRFFLDYVGDEVLAQQTPEMQRFLLCTCILERMTGSLCDAVTEMPGGQSRLVELLRANLFVSVLDDAETWYRYHPLFASALRTHLQQLEPELMPQLYLRASFWYEQQQSMEEACDYAFLAGDLSRAAQLTAELLPQLAEQGRFERLKHWLSQLPVDLIMASPQLYITLPWFHSLGEQTLETTELALTHMEQYIQEQQRDATASWAEPLSALTLIRAQTALMQNKPLRAFALVREALRTLASRETGLSQLLARFLKIFLSLTYGACGDLAAAERTLLSTLHSAEPFSLINLAATFLLGELYRAQGRLRQLGTHYETIFRARSEHLDLPAVPSLQMEFVLMRRVSLLYEWNRLPEASNGIQQILEMLPHAVLEVVPRTYQRPLVVFGLWMQARIELAQGQPEAARRLLELVRTQPELVGEMPPGKEQPPVDVPMLAARMALLCGQVADAERWERACDIHYNDAPATLLESRQMFAYLTLARILIMRGRSRNEETALAQALTLLDHWRACALQLGFQGWFIEIQMLTALALHAQGRIGQALTTLGPVLAQAEAEGYVRLFVDEGLPMAHVLGQISTYTTASPAYIRQLQAALPPVHLELPGQIQSEVSAKLIEPLSAREREVLTFMATGASNQQIADQLVISLNTAKRHVKHILAKLAATNRTQAVMRAREFHLF